MKNKILTISGPTAIGKTSLAFKLAKKFNGVLISVDSRQVYKQMDIVTGKDLPQEANWRQNHYLYQGVSIYGLDLINPDQVFSVAHFVVYARPLVKKIISQKKLPILVGGTGFWLKTLIKGADTLGVKPNHKLRKKLEKLAVSKLQKLLKKIDHQKLRTMNRSDQHNPRRLIRAIEVARSSQNQSISGLKTHFNYLNLGLKTSLDKLDQRISCRVKQRLENGAILEAKKLLKKYSPDLPSMSGIGYPPLFSYLKDEIKLKTALKKWTQAEQAYAKRQMTWFKKQPSVKWFNLNQLNWRQDLVRTVKNWYHN